MEEEEEEEETEPEKMQGLNPTFLWVLLELWLCCTGSTQGE